ncbi:MAG: zinc-binding dehydrogenase [Pseudomonadales bacterium]
MSAVLGARLCGAERIIAIDPQAARLDIARSLGATDCLAPDADLVARVRELTRGGADYVVECSGNPAAIEQAIAVLATPGWSAQVGAPPVGTHVRLDVGAVGFGRGVRGVVLGEANPQTYVPYLVALHLRGELPFDRFVTAYAFADIDRAVADAQTGAVVKPVLRMPGV